MLASTCDMAAVREESLTREELTSKVLSGIVLLSQIEFTNRANGPEFLIVHGFILP
jgi:hypothetical protein